MGNEQQAVLGKVRGVRVVAVTFASPVRVGKGQSRTLSWPGEAGPRGGLPFEVRFTPAGIERGAIFTPWSNVVDVEYAPAVEEARDDATR